ncbi:MAG: T9SS type A sorting domain-containing protein [Saprospiraceae bacterium]|nr:T9SS type A sorting domain-containing protein [Saprospiraceae bacterium]
MVANFPGLESKSSNGESIAYMNRWLLTLLLFLSYSIGQAQYRSATLNSQGLIQWHEVDATELGFKKFTRDTTQLKIMPGYPKMFPADPFFKNFRNTTLADLDADGADEIIVGSGNMLYVLRDTSVWWSRQLSGLMRFPAAVGDLDRDGSLDIVVSTGYNDEPGQIYTMRADGIDREGWPITFDGRWMLSSPALADVDQDDLLEIICADLERSWGHVYVLEADGTLTNDEWPIILPNIPAVTPSVGDIDGDAKPEIIIASTREIYAFDHRAQEKTGWPVGNGMTKFSFQSPILYDLNRDGKMDVIGEGHGDQPEFFVRDGEGQYLTNWQKPVPQGRWTFHTPTVINHNGDDFIFTARPISNGVSDVLYAWTSDGDMADGFPIVKEGGHEGITTVADIDGDLQPEILFSSNLFDSLDNGFLHAYELDGTGEVAGFPLRTRGLTFLNGATIGDVDGDDQMDLVVLSYTEHPSNEPDTTFLYVYNLHVPINPERVWWPTYKGNNLRNGNIAAPNTTSNMNVASKLLKIHPNPVTSEIYFDLPHGLWHFQLINLHGNIVVDYAHHTGASTGSLRVSELARGIYFLKATAINSTSILSQKVILQ